MLACIILAVSLLPLLHSLCCCYTGVSDIWSCITTISSFCLFCISGTDKGHIRAGTDMWLYFIVLPIGRAALRHLDPLPYTIMVSGYCTHQFLSCPINAEHRAWINLISHCFDSPGIRTPDLLYRNHALYRFGYSKNKRKKEICILIGSVSLMQLLVVCFHYVSCKKNLGYWVVLKKGGPWGGFSVWKLILALFFIKSTNLNFYHYVGMTKR